MHPTFPAAAGSSFCCSLCDGFGTLQFVPVSILWRLHLWQCMGFLGSNEWPQLPEKVIITGDTPVETKEGCSFLCPVAAKSHQQPAVRDPTPGQGCTPTVHVLHPLALLQSQTRQGRGGQDALGAHHSFSGYGHRPPLTLRAWAMVNPALTGCWSTWVSC